MKRLQKVFVLLSMLSVFAALMLTGCTGAQAQPAQTAQASQEVNQEANVEANQPADTADTAETVTNEPLRVALMLTGPANDQGFNAQAATGLRMAEEEFGIETTIMENVGVADMEALYTEFAVQGYDLIIGHGFLFGIPAATVSERFPNQFFVATNAASESANMASFSLGNQEAAYLMGILSASMTESGTIGVVAGIEQPSIIREVEAFKMGAATVDPSVNVLEIYIGSFTDVALGMEAALAMIDNGADILYHAANQAGTGVITAAQERGILAGGNSFDQNSIAPDTVMLSTVYHIPKIVMYAVEAVQNNTFEGGIFYLGMAEGIVDLSPFHSFEDIVPQEVQQLIAETMQQIIDGDLVIPAIETPTNR